LKAEPEERARRRLEQDGQQGRISTLRETIKEIVERDRLDRERTVSPLVAAPDAQVVDSTRLTASEVVDRILQLARARNLLPQA
jgi:CMP/dCMP kinase